LKFLSNQKGVSRRNEIYFVRAVFPVVGNIQALIVFDNGRAAESLQNRVIKRLLAFGDKRVLVYRSKFHSGFF
jgi:hypothetical protein